MPGPSPRPTFRTIAHLALALAALWVGCAQLPPHARQKLVEADQAYRANDTAAAVRLVDPLLKEFPKHPESAEAYYIRALCRLKAQQTSEASADLKQCLSLTPRDDLAARASAALGGLQHDAGQLAEAAASFERALRHLPERPPTDQVRFRYGSCLQKLGRWDEAKNALAPIFSKYPQSPYTEEARRRFSWPNRYYSFQCGAFANAEQAQALANRLKSALPDARSEPEARLGRPMYLVYAGKYATYAEAQSHAREMTRAAPGAFIVP